MRAKCLLTAAILRDPRDNELPVSDEKKAVFLRSRTECVMSLS